MGPLVVQRAESPEKGAFCPLADRHHTRLCHRPDDLHRHASASSRWVLELCVLAVLSRNDAYAYDIAAQLAKAIDMGEGTIYPLMRRMQTDRLVETYLVESSSGPPRKYYKLTTKTRIFEYTALRKSRKFEYTASVLP